MFIYLFIYVCVCVCTKYGSLYAVTVNSWYLFRMWDFRFSQRCNVQALGDEVMHFGIWLLMFTRGLLHSSQGSGSKADSSGTW